jgi:GH25 family lysozyme M1 (1,4-beta-N-acetylmuramidase)
MNGIDESNYQGAINNAVVPEDFDIIKATEGIGYVDADCDANFQQAKAAGRKLGFYHFFRGNDPIQEARWFVSNTDGYFGQAVPVLDIETAISPEAAKAFVDEVYRLKQVRCWIYSFESAFNTGDWSALWPNYAAWVASYGANNPQNGYGDPNAPVTINGNWTIVAVQYTSKGRLPGWGGDLDLDIAYITPAEWDKYAIGDRNQPAPVVAPVVPEPAPAQPVVPTPEPVVAPAPTPVLPPELTVIPTPVTTPIAVDHQVTPIQSIPVISKPAPQPPYVRFFEQVLAFFKAVIGVK